MAKQLKITLPDKGGELITANGRILLSMDTSFGRSGRYPPQPSVHLYLGGVFEMDDNNVAVNLANV